VDVVKGDVDFCLGVDVETGDGDAIDLNVF
jgi:hypothetical protein